ncbi:major capsid protein [Pseudomonas laurylsulfatiphila]|uniref:major capsid protein n=1 Tax=Pseudomonas laurylsulfatiphila TaxID=2011015 RepID=UPI003D1D808C|nr:murein endopeptidase [Pseudomonas reinekei]MDF9902036.1 murein endopeptidase [Pseudomonas reinekei]
MLRKLSAFPRNVGIAVAGSLMSAAAFADVDTTAVQAAITAAEGDAQSVGGYVIAAVAGLVVIGLIIGIVKKI